MMKKKNLTVSCPVCKKESTWGKNSFRPFCSKRCQNIDLGLWFSEDYSIGTTNDEFNDEFEQD